MYIPGTWILVPAPGPHAVRFFPFFRLILPNKSSRIVCCCCISLFRYFSRFFLRQSVCARDAWRLLDRRSGAAYYIHKIKVMEWLCQLGCATININMYSYIPRYVNKQSTPTTTPVVRICSCVTLFYTYIAYLFSCAVRFGRIFTCTYESFFYRLLIATYPPPKGNLVYINWSRVLCFVRRGPFSP